jgi:hypothetical protein
VNASVPTMRTMSPLFNQARPRVPGSRGALPLQQPRFRNFSRGGPEGHCRYPADRVPPVYRLQDMTGSSACIHALSHAQPLWTLPPYRGGLRHYHVSYGFGPRLVAEVGSDATMCLEAPELTSQLRWASVSPRALRLRTYNHAGKGSDAATCPTTPDPASLSVRAPTLTHVQWFLMGHGPHV